MKLGDAIEKSIRDYYAGKLPEKAIEASDDEFIYTLEYFDAMFDDTAAEPKKKERRSAKSR